MLCPACGAPMTKPNECRECGHDFGRKKVSHSVITGMSPAVSELANAESECKHFNLLRRGEYESEADFITRIKAEATAAIIESHRRFGNI
jgi:hypothetical protein